MIKVFGHKAPDTDSTGSAIIWAWYLNDVKGQAAEPALLGSPNMEAAFVLNRWRFETPKIISDVADGAQVIVVDTNNPAELPANINNADILAIIDHHKLVGGLETKGPISITIRPLACTATIMHNLMGDNAARMPEAIKGVMLSCILSDTLEFRSPTTTPQDQILAEALAADLGLSIPNYAAEMFTAKSDVSAFSDAELLRMDSKEYAVKGVKFRVSVLETTSPQMVLDRKTSLMAAMPGVAPLSSAAAPTHHHRVQTPQRRTKTSRGRANSSRVRQKPRSCLIRQLPAPPHLRIQRQLCTHHAPR